MRRHFASVAPSSVRVPEGIITPAPVCVAQPLAALPASVRAKTLETTENPQNPRQHPHGVDASVLAPFLV